MWIVLTVGAVVTGGALVGALASRWQAESLFALLSFSAFGFSLWAFLSIVTTYHRADAVLYALVFAIGGFIGGYALASVILETLIARGERPMLPRLNDSRPPGQPMVIVLGDVEPPVYGPRPIAGVLNGLAEQGILGASLALLPLVFLAQKLRYRAIGGQSPSAMELDAIAERLGTALSRRASWPVRAAWCYGERSLARVLSDSIAEGFRKFAVVNAFVADSSTVDSAKRQVDGLRLHRLGVSVTYAPSLWASERAARFIASRAMQLATGDDLERTGIALVGQAQPEESAGNRADFDLQEASFLNHVRSFLTEFGVPERNVRIAWAEWRSPDIQSTLQHLASLGCRRVIVAPASYPLDSIATVLDIPHIAGRALANRDISVVTLPAWHDDPELIEVLRSDALHVLEHPAPEEGV